MRGEEHRRLAGSVAGADDVHVEPVGVRRLAACRSVRDSLSRQPIEPVGGQLPPRDAAREDDRLRLQDIAAVEEQLAGAGVDPLDRARHEDLCAEPPRLLERAARQLIARDAGREPEVVLDAGRRSGLTAGRLALDHDRAEALRRAVHRCRQAGGTGADDHRVVLGCGRLCVEAEQLRDPTQLRFHDRFPVDDADHGAVVLRRKAPAPLLDRLRLVGLKPGERDLVPVEEPPQLRAPAIPAISDHDRPRWRRLRRDARQPTGPAHPIAGERADGLHEPGFLGGDRVVVLRLDSHHPRGLSRAEPDGKDRPQRDRNLADQLAGMALADDARDPVHEFHHLDMTLEQGEQRAPVALVRRVLAGGEVDVGGSAGEALPALRAQGSEVGNPLDFLRGDHRGRR